MKNLYFQQMQLSQQDIQLLERKGVVLNKTDVTITVVGDRRRIPEHLRSKLIESQPTQLH